MILHADHDRLNEIYFEGLDEEMDEETLFRMGPRMSQFGTTPMKIDYSLEDDDDVFLTRAEIKLLFPLRFGINPERIREKRKRYFDTRKIKPNVPKLDSPKSFSHYKNRASFRSEVAPRFRSRRNKSTNYWPQ